jgi:hypothetical protein
MKNGLGMTALLLLVTIPFSLTALVWFQNYEEFTVFILNQAQAPEKLLQLRELFPAYRFTRFRGLLSVVSLFSFGLAFGLWKHRNKLPTWLTWENERLSEAVNAFLHPITCLTPLQKVAIGLLALLVVMSRLYFLDKYVLHLDERFSYLYFVSKGIGVTLTYYPNPNNHILFNLLCQPAHWLFSDPLLVMRLPAVLIGWLTIRFFLGILLHFFPFRLAYPAALLWAFSPYCWYYSIHGRGYGLVYLCFLLAAASCIKQLYAQREQVWLKRGFVISSTLGFYAVPVYLYPFCGMALLAGLYCLFPLRLRHLQSWLMQGLAVAGLTFLLYLPVLVFSGPHAIWGNSWVLPQEVSAFFAQLPVYWQELCGIFWYDLSLSSWLIPGQLLLATWLAFDPKIPLAWRGWMQLLLACWIALCLVLLVQRPVLYHRSYAAFWIFQPIWLAVLLSKWRLGSLFYWVLALLLAGWNLLQAWEFVHRKEWGFYKSADAVAAWLYNRNAQRLFFNTYEQSLCVRFYYQSRDRTVDMQVQRFEKAKDCLYLVVDKAQRKPDTTGFVRCYDDPLTCIFAKR